MEKEGLFVKWVNAANGTWITYSLTSPRFQDRVLDQLLRDPNENNNSPLMRIVEEGDGLARQRLEFLDLVRKNHNTYDESVQFLKGSIPVTNPVTITLVQEMKYHYPITLAEKVKFASMTIFSVGIEVIFSYLDVHTDVKVALKPLVDETCQSYPYEILNTTICSLNECSLSYSLIPHFTEASLLVTTLPWVLGIVIIFSQEDKFWEIYGHFTETEKLRRWELLFKKMFFLVGM